MSSAPPSSQHISGTSATDNSAAFAGVIQNLNLTSIARECRYISKNYVSSGSLAETCLASRPLRAFSTVPFRRDPNFVDRGDLLSCIDERCSQPAGRAALVGLGGVGKSQLAIEYTYRVRKRSPSTWVFWIHASSPSHFEQGYRDIADAVKIAGREEPTAHILKMAHDWLREHDGTWLMILDDLDNIDIFPEKWETCPDSQGSGADVEVQLSILAFIPRSENGSILITSRNKAAALELVERNECVVVEPMTELQAVELFEKSLGEFGADEPVAELAAAVDYIPLAIMQAGSYICERRSRCSVQHYLTKFRENDSRRASLLRKEGGQSRRDGRAKSAILITWQISFDQINNSRPSAANLLSLMSFCDRRGIAENLIKRISQSNQETISRKEDRSNKDQEISHEDDDGESGSVSDFAIDDQFEQDMQTLQDYAFAKLEGGRIYRMHALVQLAVQRWLVLKQDFELWHQYYIHALSKECAKKGYENQGAWRVLFPHARAAMTQRPNERSLLDWASVLHRAAQYALENRDIAEISCISQMAEKALEVRETLLGHEHGYTLSSLLSVSRVYRLDGRSKEAEEMQLKAFETSQKRFGPGNSFTLHCETNLASTRLDLGNHKESETQLEDILAMKQKSLGMEHSSTIYSMKYLAKTYEKQRRLEEAEKLYVSAIGAGQKEPGKTHPAVFDCLGSLALLHYHRRRYKEAEELLCQALDIGQKTFCKEHPKLLGASYYLAKTYQKQGRTEEAEELHTEVLSLRRISLGNTHSHTLSSFHHLTKLYMNKKSWDKAEDLQVSLMNTSERMLGKEHRVTLLAMYHIALIWKELGRITEAIDLMSQCARLNPSQVWARYEGDRLPSASSILETWLTEHNETISPQTPDQSTTGQAPTDIEEAATFPNEADATFPMDEMVEPRSTVDKPVEPSL